MEHTRALERMWAKGEAAQIAIAGTYAWIATVAPVAASDFAPVFAKFAAAGALVSVVGGAAAQGSQLSWLQPLALAGFLAGSSATWLAAPSALRPPSFEPFRSFAGMFGWGLFAIAWAGPSLGARREPARLIAGSPLLPRQPSRSGYGYLIGGVASAIALQGAGWDAGSAEHALLVRVVSIAAGLATIGVSAEVALSPRVTHALAIVLIVSGVSAFIAAEAALARADDVRAMCWVALGAAALFTCVRVATVGAKA